MSYEPIVDRVIKMKPDGQVIRFIKGFVRSTDRKPISGIADGSSLFEEDTGKQYLYSEELHEWIASADLVGELKSFVDSLAGALYSTLQLRISMGDDVIR